LEESEPKIQDCGRVFAKLMQPEEEEKKKKREGEATVHGFRPWAFVG
jgi:hypothetical protein